MTPRERLLTTLKGEIPDCVPVAPDFSNMIPAKLTGRPFWDLYLYQQIPIWEAYIRCARYFNIDAVMDGYFPLTFPEENQDPTPWETFIIQRNQTRIVTQRSHLDGAKRDLGPHGGHLPRRRSARAHHVKPETVHIPPDADPFRTPGRGAPRGPRARGAETGKGTHGRPGPRGRFRREHRRPRHRRCHLQLLR
jgi:hypothetical protein